jgi:hypothetical protein
MCLLFVLIASQIDFVIGSFMGPQDDEEIAKGFVGYNCEFLSTILVNTQYSVVCCLRL